MGTKTLRSASIVCVIAGILMVFGPPATRAQQIDDLAQAGRYGPGKTVPALARGFAAFLRQDYDTAIAEIEPVVMQIERIGGSRAQRDLVEFTLLKACANAGRNDDARRLIAARRPGPPASPVAGLPTLH